jgi:hypothetical protein
MVAPESFLNLEPTSINGSKAASDEICNSSVTDYKTNPKRLLNRCRDTICVGFDAFFLEDVALSLKTD